jgi:uncharacterized protein with HEPN domain
MQPEPKKLLFDMHQAIELLIEFTDGKAYGDYEASALLRSAVERQLEIVGEAATQLARQDPAVASRITNHRRIIAFRNILIHGYSQVDDRLVWDILQTALPVLRAEVNALLGID